MLLKVNNLLTHNLSEPEIVTDNRLFQLRGVERVAEADLPTESGKLRITGCRSLVSVEEFIVVERFGKTAA